MIDKKKVLITSVASDSHSWNLVFMQLWLEEHSFEVQNLGNCVPAAEVVEACAEFHPALLVVSTVNGHGAIDGMKMIETLKTASPVETMRVVIGGKLSTAVEEQQELRRTLLEAGYDGVFTGPSALPHFERYMESCGLMPSTELKLATA